MSIPPFDHTHSCIYHSPNLPVLRLIPADTVDLVATDPPYGLALMGKRWDRTLPDPATWAHCLRILKPGASMVLTMTSRLDLLWRLCRDIEEAGFDLTQPSLYWVYKSGFPKGSDLSKAADLREGAEREVIGSTSRRLDNSYGGYRHLDGQAFGEKVAEDLALAEAAAATNVEVAITRPGSALGQALDGWYTKGKLKPAVEIIIWATKPCDQPTYLDNMVKWGVGGINCLECMIPHREGTQLKPDKPLTSSSAGMQGEMTDKLEAVNNLWTGDRPEGKFPANVLCEAGALGPDCSHFFDLDAWASAHALPTSAQELAAAGILDVPKPDERDRNFGCITGPNRHPTVKPLALFAFLVSLLTKPGAVVLDPFCGSGTCPAAAAMIGRTAIGIELEQHSAQTATERLHSALNPPPPPAEEAGVNTLF